MTVLTDRFAWAVDYARIAHATQVRKGTTIPRITHLLGIATCGSKSLYWGSR